MDPNLHAKRGIQIKREDRECCKVGQEFANRSLKVKKSGKNPYLAILDWRKTTSVNIWDIANTKSVCKTLVPTAGTLLEPKIVEATQDKLKETKAEQEHYYNKRLSYNW